MSIEYKKNLDMSVDEILKSIKEVINNRDPQANNDILELTDIIEHKKVLETTNQLPQNLSNKVDIKGQPLPQGTSVSGKTGIGITKAGEDREYNTGKGKILEDLIVEILHIHLTKWLDKNLPCLVKHLVKKEIQRLMPNNQK